MIKTWASGLVIVLSTEIDITTMTHFGGDNEMSLVQSIETVMVNSNEKFMLYYGKY